jgi:PAS domain S-box-containing protein
VTKPPSNLAQPGQGGPNPDEVAQWLAAIVDSSDDAIIGKDLDGIIMSWNSGAQRIFGYEAEEVIGKPVTILIPPDRHDEEPGILARIRAGERVEHYETVRRRKDGALLDISLTISPVRDDRGNIVGASKIARDITSRKKSEKHRELLMAELSHRVKNTLAIVLSIERLTFPRLMDGSANRAFRARIQALAQAHGRLAESQWLGVSLQRLIEDELAPYAQNEPANTDLSGPPVTLDPRCAVNMALAIHELATNAAKHGALSSPQGRVMVTWERAREGVRMTWREEGGPPVAQPGRAGFGRLLLEQALHQELDSSVSMDFRPEGLRCTILIPNQELEAQSA